MAVDSGIASRGYRKSLQGYRNSLQGFRKTLQGYRKSLQGYRNSLQRFRKSLQGFRKSLQGYRKSPEGARKSPEGSRSSNFDSVVSFRVAETTRNPRRQNATRSTAGDPSPSSRLWMTHSGHSTMVVSEDLISRPPVEYGQRRTAPADLPELISQAPAPGSFLFPLETFAQRGHNCFRERFARPRSQFPRQPVGIRIFD